MKNTFLNTIDLDVIDNALALKGYYIIRDPQLTALAESARQEYHGFLPKTPLQAPNKKFTYAQLCELGSWKKAAISSRNGVGEQYAQFLVTTYFAPKLAATPELNKVFGLLEGVRNKLMRVADDFASVPSRDKFWNAARVHHYPSGGGFMTGHFDTYFPVALGDKPFYQVCVLLSRRGTDFETGGGFVLSREDGKKIDLEAAGGFGSMVIFDGKTFHGVDDVDSHQIPDLQSLKGRLAAFSTVYNYST